MLSQQANQENAVNVSFRDFPNIQIVLGKLLARAVRPTDSDLSLAFKEFCVCRSEPDIYSAESYMRNLLTAAPERLEVFLSSPDVIMDGDQDADEIQYFIHLFGSEDKLDEANEVIWGLYEAVETLPA